MENILINIFCGFAGGFLVYLFQYKNEEKNKRNYFIDNFKNNKKKLPNDFIYSLQPGISMNKVEQLIGIPDYSYKFDEIELFGEGSILNFNEYYFLNCKIKIIHSNNQLDSIFVYGYYDTDIKFIKYNSEFDKNILLKYAVDYTFEDNTKIIYELTARDCWYGIIEYHGRIGNYNSFCYYGNLEPSLANDNLKIDNLKNRLVESFAISNNDEVFKYH